jgi:hypothetical protein
LVLCLGYTELNMKKATKAMTPTVLELEGTAAEIRALLPDFSGQRIHVTVRPLTLPEAAARPEEECTLIVPETNEQLAARFQQKQAARLTEDIPYSDVELPTSLAGAVW